MNGLNILKQRCHAIVNPLAAELETLHPDAIACRAAKKRFAANRNQRRAIVLYDSETGSTWKVAKEIAGGLGCEAKRITDVSDLSQYELVVFGSPSVGTCATAPMSRFLEMSLDRPPLIAFFCTVSMPVPGAWSAWPCLRAMAVASGRKPITTFSCPGTRLVAGARWDRPNRSAQRKAYRFGLRLAQKLKRS